MTSPKFKLTELSILLNLYFLEELEQVKTNIYTNIHFERVLFFRDLQCSTLEISKLLRDAAFTWRPKELSHRLKK